MSARTVERVVRSVDAMEGAGVRIRRSIGVAGFDHLDPFLLLDEFKSDEASDYLAGFPDHPHRGFETVTYMLAGRMRHEDHAGNKGDLRAGSVQWMTAGRGIVHSEMPQQENGLMWGFQMWVNLPAKEKMTAPRYQDIAPEEIPDWEEQAGVRLRLIAGTLSGRSGPVSGISSRPLYVDVRLQAGVSWEIGVPDGHNAFVYVFENDARIADESSPCRAGELAALNRAGTTIGVTAGSDGASLLVVAAAPLGEPVARYGPFVMNTREEIRQAFEDYRQGRFV